MTENIDETPQGKLIHIRFSGLGRSTPTTLATVGTQQKVLAGGTPTMAPLGSALSSSTPRATSSAPLSLTARA